MALVFTTREMADPTWQEALNWLKLAGTMPALRLSSLLDFAAALQNGEILCLTANRSAQNIVRCLGYQIPFMV
jgi:hypothetical protein